MLKRVGVLAFVLSAGALLQPALASAQDRFDRGREYDRGRVVEVLRDQPRYVREYVVPVRRDDCNRDRVVVRRDGWRYR